jgi:large subunit ribosomal protein LP0
MVRLAGEAVYSQKKIEYFSRMKQFMEEYPKIFIIHVDNVTSKQFMDIRYELRGKAEILMGKNTLMRRVLRDCVEEHPEYETLINEINGNIGLVFCGGDLKEIRDIIVANKKQAPARAGALSPIDVFIEPQNTGMEANKTSFFQALNVPTKIARGTVEITSRVQVCTAGEKVGPSEASLLNLLKISPFFYGVKVLNIYDAGSTYPPDVLDIDSNELVNKIMTGATEIAAYSLAVNRPTLPSVMHSVVNGYKNVISVAFQLEAYSFPAAEKGKAFLKDPEAALAALAAAAPAGGGGGGGGGGGAKEEAKAEEKEEEEEEDDGSMGGGLFGDDDDGW